MQANVTFLDCPAYMVDDGAVRCGLPAAVERWYAAESTSGPLENAKIRCPRGHDFNGPVKFLTITSAGQPVGSGGCAAGAANGGQAGRCGQRDDHRG
jgi:hypothetical protein